MIYYRQLWYYSTVWVFKLGVSVCGLCSWRVDQFGRDLAHVCRQKLNFKNVFMSIMTMHYCELSFKACSHASLMRLSWNIFTCMLTCMLAIQMMYICVGLFSKRITQFWEEDTLANPCINKVQKCSWVGIQRELNYLAGFCLQLHLRECHGNH